ncbi:MAG: hypothetical protein HY875_12540 [Chloroflexi bacterium]|nr:hypothetical protein [Chloroflexota bacterium]
MKLRFGLVAIVLAGGVVVAACGDGPDKPAATPTYAATRVATSVPGSFSAAPKLGGNVTVIYPAHATSVAQAGTKLRGNSKSGVCADVNFDGITTANAQWFRMAVDGVEVTPKLYWFVSDVAAPTGGTVCHIPAEGLTVGRHNAAVTVTDPRSSTASPRQIVAWEFDVTP